MYKLFTKFANWVAQATGRPYAFVICLGLVIVWAVSGPVFKFSDTWQLVINTSTTIVTFLMVFLIQNTQNRESDAVQAKLDTLILGLARADNRYVGIEHLTDQELEKIVEEAEKRAGKARTESPRARSTARRTSRAAGKVAAARGGK